MHTDQGWNMKGRWGGGRNATLLLILFESRFHKNSTTIYEFILFNSAYALENFLNFVAAWGGKIWGAVCVYSFFHFQTSG